MEKAHTLVNARDINLICQSYKTYAQIEGVARRRKITRTRRRYGILEVRTAAREQHPLSKLEQSTLLAGWTRSGRIVRFSPG
jgi:hypothetical protein